MKNHQIDMKLKTKFPYETFLLNHLYLKNFYFILIVRNNCLFTMFYSFLLLFKLFCIFHYPYVKKNLIQRNNPIFLNSYRKK